MKILACAVSFGLGPNGKLCSIINYNKKYEWYACGDKLDLSIYKENPFIDVCWTKNEKNLEEFIKKYNIKYAIDVLDPDMAIFLKKVGIKVIYVDSLPFMWTKADLIPYNVDYYCAQKYPEYKMNPVLKRVKKFVWINPITLGKIKQQNKSGIVINFGGLHSPYGEGREYFEIVMKALLQVLSKKDIIITGGSNVVKLANTLFPKLLSITYSHEEFLNKVSNAELFITSPGLTTIYETCGMDIKTIILPPQNLSQFYNIEIAEKTCRNVKVLRWNSSNLSMKQIKTFKDKPEEETVKYIYEQIYNLSKNERDIINFKEYVANKLEDKYVSNKINLFDNNGVIEISEIINSITEQYEEKKYEVYKNK